MVHLKECILLRLGLQAKEHPEDGPVEMACPILPTGDRSCHLWDTRQLYLGGEEDMVDGPIRVTSKNHPGG